MPGITSIGDIMTLESLMKLRTDLLGEGGLNTRHMEILCSEEEGPIDQAFAKFLWEIDEEIRRLCTR